MLCCVLSGVFMMVAGGIVAGVVLIFVEIAYKRHRGLKDKELELARNAADRWRGNIEVCIS
jgi:ionotropic glutamate receptor NMDA 1